MIVNTLELYFKFTVTLSVFEIHMHIFEDGYLDMIPDIFISGSCCCMISIKREQDNEMTWENIITDKIKY